MLRQKLRPIETVGRKSIMGIAKAMPNWIPVLIVLLTQGASGSIATVHPHDMVRMIQLVARWEESTAEAVAANPYFPAAAQAKIRISHPASAAGQPPQIASRDAQKSSDLTRDGPILIS